MRLRNHVIAIGLSVLAFIALTALPKPCLVPVHVGSEFVRLACAIMLPYVAIGLFAGMLYDLLSFTGNRPSRRSYEPILDDAALAVGGTGRQAAGRSLRFVLVYPLTVAIWCGIGILWLSITKCPGSGLGGWMPG